MNERTRGGGKTLGSFREPNRLEGMRQGMSIIQRHPCTRFAFIDSNHRCLNGDTALNLVVEV